MNGQRLKYPVNIARLKSFVHRQFRPTRTPEKSDIEISPEANIAPNDINNAEDNEENTDQILDDESNNTEAQNANEPQSPEYGEENTDESNEIQTDSDDLPHQYYKIDTILRHKGRPGNKTVLSSKGRL